MGPTEFIVFCGPLNGENMLYYLLYRLITCINYQDKKTVTSACHRTHIYHGTLNYLYNIMTHIVVPKMTYI